MLFLVCLCSFFLSKGSLFEDYLIMKFSWQERAKSHNLKLPTMIIWTYFEALQGQQRNTFLLSGLSTQIHLLHAFSSFLDFQKSIRPRIFICIYSKNLQCSKDWILFRSATLKFFILGQTLFFQQQQQQNKKQKENKKQIFQVSTTLCYDFFLEIP